MTDGMVNLVVEVECLLIDHHVFGSSEEIVGDPVVGEKVLLYANKTTMHAFWYNEILFVTSSK